MMKKIFAALVVVLVMACVASANLVYVNEAGSLVSVKANGTEETTDITSEGAFDTFEFTLNGKSMILLLYEINNSDNIAIYDPDDISAPVVTNNVSSTGFERVVNVAVLGNSLVLSGYNTGSGAKIIEVNPNTCEITNTYTHYPADGNNDTWFFSYVYAWDSKLVACFEARTETEHLEETVIMDTFGNITGRIEDCTFDDGFEVSGGEAYIIIGNSGYEDYNENPDIYGAYRITEALSTVNIDNAVQIIRTNPGYTHICRDGRGGFYYTVRSDTPEGRESDYLHVRYIYHWNGSSSTRIYDAGEYADIAEIGYDINNGVLYAAFYDDNNDNRNIIALTSDSSGQFSISRTYANVPHATFSLTGNPPDTSSSSGNGGAVTVPEESQNSPASQDVPLQTAQIEPVTIDNDTKQNLADLIPAITDKDQIHEITPANLSSAQEPTAKMREYMRNDGYNAAYKLDTVTVDESGYYVFAVNIPAELVGQDIDSIRMYALNDSELSGSFIGIINGVLNYGELTDLTGHKPKTLVGKMLAVGLLQGSQPFSMFLAKAIVSVLTGGAGSCSVTGAGLVLCLSVMAVMIRRKQ